MQLKFLFILSNIDYNISMNLVNFLGSCYIGFIWIGYKTDYLTIIGNLGLESNLSILKGELICKTYFVNSKLKQNSFHFYPNFIFSINFSLVGEACCHITSKFLSPIKAWYHWVCQTKKKQKNYLTSFNFLYIFFSSFSYKTIHRST